VDDSQNPFKPVEEALGAVFNLLARHHPHSGRPLGKIHGHILSPIALGQYRLVRNQDGEAVGYASWAKVSPEAERKYVEGQGRPEPSEWQCGDVALLIDLVADDPKIAQSMVWRLKRDLFADAVFKSRGVNPKNGKTEWMEVPNRSGS